MDCAFTSLGAQHLPQSISTHLYLYRLYRAVCIYIAGVNL